MEQSDVSTHHQSSERDGLVQSYVPRNLSGNTIEKIVQPQRHCDSHEEERYLKVDRQHKDELVDAVDGQ